MLEETKSIVYGFDDDFLPLKTYVNIEEANALTLNWENVISLENLDFIMGNPPFVGAKYQTKEQKKYKTTKAPKVNKNVKYVWVPRTGKNIIIKNHVVI